MNNKNIIVRLFTGFKKGFLTPTLPENILKIQSYPLIRILRFLGGVSMLFVLSRAHTNFPIYFLYIATFFMFLFFVYHIIISYYRVKHVFKLLKSDALEVKNSPLDRIATFGARLVLCLKGSCEAAQPIGVALGLALGTDEIFKSAGREPVFAPLLGKTLNAVLANKKGNGESVPNLIQIHLKNIEANQNEIKSLESTIDMINQGKASGSLTGQEAKEFITAVQEHINTVNGNSDSIKTKITEILNKK